MEPIERARTKRPGDRMHWTWRCLLVLCQMRDRVLVDLTRWKGRYCPTRIFNALNLSPYISTNTIYDVYCDKCLRYPVDAQLNA